MPNCEYCKKELDDSANGNRRYCDKHCMYRQRSLERKEIRQRFMCFDPCDIETFYHNEDERRKERTR